jgi:hypothetical protein
MLPGDLFSLVLRVLFKLRRGGSLPMWRSRLSLLRKILENWWG